jgi:glycosyltransferase involved in cell wall biosynthesis
MPAVNALADVQLVHLRDLPFFAATVPSKTQVALASGRPVLMCVAGDAARIVQHAGAGLTAPPENPAAMAEAIMALYNETPEARAAMGERGRRYYLDHMGLDTGGHQMDQLLRRVASGDARVPAREYRPSHP